MKGRFKYVCLECNAETWFAPYERTRAAGMRCSACGCRQLAPSKESVARERIATSNAEAAEQEVRITNLGGRRL